MRVNMNVTVWELHLDLDSMNEVHPLSNRCRTRWIIKSAERVRGGHSELPLWEGRRSYFCRPGTFSCKAHKQKLSDSPTLICLPIPPSILRPSMMFNSHTPARTQTQGRDSEDSEDFHYGSIFLLMIALWAVDNVSKYLTNDAEMCFFHITVDSALLLIQKFSFCCHFITVYRDIRLTNVQQGRLRFKQNKAKAAT